MDMGGFAARRPVVAGSPQTLDAASAPDPEPTGDAEVDTALDRLRELAERPTGAHPELYDDVHQRLQTVLARLDRQGAAQR